MWYVRGVLYAVLYVRVSCFVVRGCGVSRSYIDVCYCDMFSVVNVCLYHLKFCVVCINSRMYVCCSECDVVSKSVMRSGKRPRLRARRVKVRFSLRAIILGLENLNVIIRAIN